MASMREYKSIDSEREDAHISMSASYQTSKMKKNTDLWASASSAIVGIRILRRQRFRKHALSSPLPLSFSFSLPLLPFFSLSGRRRATASITTNTHPLKAHKPL
jgi:hypothetical protein